ncbi:MAG TPA: hypothetical protein DGG95_15655 [Cytophagales bacterium]|jgi:hypothetical protein|nr:hypothetical protein [Cytophagales bacterium]
MLGFSQTKINKSIAVQPGQKIKMKFDYPELIKVSTWDKNEILVTGDVSINEGENDDAFKMELVNRGNDVLIEGEIKNLNGLPHRVTVWNNSQKMSFKSKEDYRKYASEHGKNFNRMNWGTDIDIFLEIKVPANVETKVLSTYGTIEIKNFTGPLTAESTYGGVDAALNEKSIGDLQAETNYGEIFTNFDYKFHDGELKDFHTVVKGKPGSGPRYTFESTYGNVYLRKAM